MNSATVEPCSTVTVPPPREAAKCAASTKLAVPSLFLVGPTTIKHFFLLNQTVLCVAAGEPHPRHVTKRAQSLFIFTSTWIIEGRSS
jgi:hypothetical protein